jgi:hypothetical protein
MIISNVLSEEFTITGLTSFGAPDHALQIVDGLKGKRLYLSIWPQSKILLISQDLDISKKNPVEKCTFEKLDNTSHALKCVGATGDKEVNLDIILKHNESHSRALEIFSTALNLLKNSIVSDPNTPSTTTLNTNQKNQKKKKLKNFK